VSKPRWLAGHGRWLLVPIVAASLVGGALVARELLPLRSILGLIDEGGCTPDLLHTRLPSNTPSEAGRWQLAHPYPNARDEVRAAAVAGRIYVGTGIRLAGGEFRSLDELFRFDPVQEMYESLPDLPERVDHPAFVVHRGALYVIGGYRDLQPIASVWSFDPGEGRWTALEPMRVPRASPAAAAIGNRIYVTGGSEIGRGDDLNGSRSLEIYDVGTGEWTRGADMVTPRHHHGAVALNGELYVVGGRGRGEFSLDAVERFDPASGRWEQLAPLPLGVGGLSVIASAGMVITIGGGDDGESWVTPATWGLDPDEGEWRRLADLNVARHGHGAATVGDQVYVFAGAPCPGYGVTDVVESFRPSTATRAGSS
jgi:N-acetylneuraminic acid mutarotase